MCFLCVFTHSHIVAEPQEHAGFRGMWRLYGHNKTLQLSPENENVAGELANIQQSLHFKVVEFLIFYMTDESELKDGRAPVRTVAEKAGYIKPQFPAIEDLIENLNDLSTQKSRGTPLSS